MCCVKKLRKKRTLTVLDVFLVQRIEVTTTVQIPRKENIERFFTRVFDTYIANNRNQVLLKLKKTMMVEMLGDYMERYVHNS